MTIIVEQFQEQCVRTLSLLVYEFRSLVLQYVCATCPYSSSMGEQVDMYERTCMCVHVNISLCRVLLCVDVLLVKIHTNSTQ